MQLDFLLFLQDISNPVLDAVALGLTMLGEPAAVSLLFCAVYWCVDKEVGRGLVCALCASLCLNGVVKDFVRADRPIGQEGIDSLRAHTATGYSFPSGHTQTAAVFWTSLSLWGKKRPLWALSLCLMAGVGMSRLYLGLHYPVDVLGGLVLGALAAVAVYLLLRRGKPWGALVLCGALALAALLTGESRDTLTAAGMVPGLLAGLWVEARFARFSTRGLSLSRQAFRMGVGMCLLGLAYLLPKLFLPDHTLWHALRYAFAVFTGLGLCPLLFTRLRL